MFGASLPEFMLLCAGALIVLGPKRLPEALRTLGLWQRRIASSYRSLRWELEREMPEEPTISGASAPTPAEPVPDLEPGLETGQAVEAAMPEAGAQPGDPAPSSGTPKTPKTPDDPS